MPYKNEGIFGWRKMQMGGILDARQGAPVVPENTMGQGPDDVPALLTSGEAVIPAEAAQDPNNRPTIDAMIQQGRERQMTTSPEAKQYIQGVQRHLRNYERELKGMPKMNLGGYVNHYNMGTPMVPMYRGGGWAQYQVGQGFVSKYDEQMRALLEAMKKAQDEGDNVTLQNLQQQYQKLEQMAAQERQQAEQPQQQPTQMFGQPGVPDTQDPQAASGLQRGLEKAKRFGGKALGAITDEGFTDKLAQLAALQGDTGIQGYQQIVQQQQARDAARQAPGGDADTEQKVAGIKAAVDRGDLTEEQGQRAIQQTYGGGDRSLSDKEKTLKFYEDQLSSGDWTKEHYDQAVKELTTPSLAAAEAAKGREYGKGQVTSALAYGDEVQAKGEIAKGTVHNVDRATSIMQARPNLFRFNERGEGAINDAAGRISNFVVDALAEGVEVPFGRLSVDLRENLIKAGLNQEEVDDYMQVTQSIVNLQVEARKRIAGQGPVTDAEAAHVFKTIADLRGSGNAIQESLEFVKFAADMDLEQERLWNNYYLEKGESANKTEFRTKVWNPYSKAAYKQYNDQLRKEYGLK